MKKQGTMKVVDKTRLGCFPGKREVFRVTDAAFGAKGDGVTNDRAAIQAAIDAATKNGGGVVVLDADRTFISGNLILKSNVELHFERGTMLKQSACEDDYVDPVGREAPIGSPWKPIWGYDATEWKDILWGHSWAYNYPFLYAGEGCENVAITGQGTIRMMAHPYHENVMVMEHESCIHCMHIMPMGFFRVKGLTIQDVTIDGYQGWACHIDFCEDVLVDHFNILNFQCSCTDGLGVINCQNVLIQHCRIITGDDGLGLVSSHGDPRKNRWSSNSLVLPLKNVEICNCTVLANHPCKGIAIFPTSVVTAPDPEAMAMTDIYIHDNILSEIGVWTHGIMWGHPEDTRVTPMRRWVLENNEIGIVQDNMRYFEVEDLTCDDGRIMALCSKN